MSHIPSRINVYYKYDIIAQCYILWFCSGLESTKRPWNGRRDYPLSFFLFSGLQAASGSSWSFQNNASGSSWSFQNNASGSSWSFQKMQAVQAGHSKIMQAVLISSCPFQNNSNGMYIKLVIPNNVHPKIMQEVSYR